MGHRFDGQERSGRVDVRPRALPASFAACLLAAVALAGCGESSGKSASVATTTKAATTATTPTTPTTPATTSTAAKPPSSSGKHSSTTPAKTTTTPSKPPPPKKPSQTPEEQKNGFGKIKIVSTAFKAGGPIATQYTCDGAGTSPPLEWHGVPRGTAEVVVLALNLSSSTSGLIQWAVAGIPASATSIPAGGLPAGAVAGVNSSGKVGWAGICGAKGQQQRVAFLFYALNHHLGLKSGFNPNEVRGGLKGATLATGLTLATHKSS
jgi:phosphatidylethanolamine-binding protein (PEBP) family uncharacterized protein